MFLFCFFVNSLVDLLKHIVNFVGMGSRSERDKKWSQKAAAAEKVVQRAISFHSMADDVLAIKDRWAEPTSAAIKLTEDVIVAPLRSSHTFPALEFGHRAELSLIKCWQNEVTESSSSRTSSFSDLKKRSQHTHTHHTQSMDLIGSSFRPM